MTRRDATIQSAEVGAARSNALYTFGDYSPLSMNSTYLPRGWWMYTPLVGLSTCAVLDLGASNGCVATSTPTYRNLSARQEGP